ncbi:MAG TPA: inorganic diphosphatase [Devosia sp.]|jgi:inorganic pyrophosphatase|uniref:inorganic diphosphatase n=1 Tax=Devosia sp. TaxID=1871048 RepID=UPI002DDD50B7|nr:inorganic diphosphatase [Devosia sp.]HEV2518075.1 inorganic diphosphatase [Devosia sp.]
MTLGIAGLPTFAQGGAVHVVVETPAGSRIKFKFDSQSGVFMMHKALAQGFAMPFPFGFIPGTKGGDGDPLDAMLITTLQPPMGAVTEAIVIGALMVEQSESGGPAVRNDRFLVLPKVEHGDRNIASVDDLPPAEVEDLEQFFIQSGERDGKQVRMLGRAGPEKAMSLVKAGRT